MGVGLGEKLPETKSQMLPGTPFKPECAGDGCQPAPGRLRDGGTSDGRRRLPTRPLPAIRHV